MSWILRAARDLDRARRLYRAALGAFTAGAVTAAAAMILFLAERPIAGAGLLATSATLIVGANAFARAGDRYRQAADDLVAALGARASSPWN
jgi:hypothetical protein